MTNKKHSENEVGKIAVIIGGSSGIGQNAASEIAKRGIGVILTYNTHKDGANETVAAIENVGGKAVALPLDAGKSETFASFKDAVAQALKDKWERSTFTYLVNNAGFGEMATIEGTSEELFDRLINVNFKAPFFITQKLLPRPARLPCTQGLLKEALPMPLQKPVSLYLRDIWLLNSVNAEFGLMLLLQVLHELDLPMTVLKNSLKP